jgi:hypothetical protein
MDRVEYMVRKVAIIADTDSSIISLDAWYQYNLQKVYNIPMVIKGNVYKPLLSLDEEDDEVELVGETDMVLDYDFYTDEVIETQKLINPLNIIPQDGLRYSIINILAFCLSRMIVDYMTEYTKNSQSYDPRRTDSVKVLAKNEF